MIYIKFNPENSKFPESTMRKEIYLIKEIRGEGYKAFIDLKQIEPYLAREFLIKY